jgi:predicted amidophosphoribosyltransferase
LIKVVCAMCGKHLSWTGSTEERGLSHGLCEDCLEPFTKTVQIRPQYTEEEIEQINHEADARLAFYRQGQP